MDSGLAASRRPGMTKSVGYERFHGIDRLVSDLDVASRRILDRREHAAAGLARRHFGMLLGLDPVEPVRPPGAGVLLGLCQPGLDVAARGRGPGPVLVFHPAG